MKKRVVIIGGGFAGSHVAKKLDKTFEVTLIDTKDYFEFTPGVLRTIVEPDHVRKIQVLHTHYLKYARVITGRVKEIRKDFVKVKGRKVKFDYLVIASGSDYNTPFKEQQIVIATRARRLRNNYNKLCKAKRVLIIGGGVVGVELAGEICWKYKDKEITIVHAKERLIERNNRKAMGYAENFLKKRGVKIYFNERILKEKNGKWVTDKGRKIEADIVFLCTGIKPNYEFMKKKFSNVLSERGQIKTNYFMQLEGYENIFVAGDVTSIKEEKTAQNAERQGEVIYKNICNLDSGKKLCEYKTKKTPLIISLGKWNAIMSKGDFVMSGFIPGLMKEFIEKWEMYKKRRVN